MASLNQGVAIGLAAVVASSLCVFVLGQSDNPAPTPSLADAAARMERRIEALEKRTPGPGMLMANAQLNFAKLWYALQHENWELAAFYLHEVAERLEEAAFARPEEGGVNLVGLTDAMKAGPLAKIESEVIAKKDKSALEATYTEAIQVCNGCHQQTGRGFIRVMIPSAPPVYSQDWKPLPK